MAKPADDPTRRTSGCMLKVKHHRTADCVVAGYRMAQGRRRGRFAAARPVRRRRHAAPRRRRRIVHGQAPQGAGRGAGAAARGTRCERHPWRDWAEAQRGGRAARMPGAASRWNARRTCRGSRCAASGWSRSSSTSSSRAASGTSLASSAGAPTASPTRCTYAQLEVARAAASLRQVSSRTESGWLLGPRGATRGGSPSIFG